MGLAIALQDEFGGHLEIVTDPKNILGRLLSEYSDYAHPILSSIDLYGDTIFNRIQMDRFLAEWAEALANAKTPEQKDLISAVEILARRCRDETHLYLKFIGD
jgi:hypothetical protein